MTMKRKGVSLIITLWITALLSCLAASFAYRTTLNIKMVKYWEDELKVYYAAQEQIEIAKAYILKDDNNYDTINEDWRKKALQASLEEARSGKDNIRRGFFIIDEEAKLDLNTAAQEMLLALDGIDKELCDSILDWRDQDNQRRPLGAEDAYYSSQGYECRNGPFVTTYELYLLKGIDEDRLRGEDANHNGALDANEDDGVIFPPDDNADGRLDKGIDDLVTAFSSGRINVNTAPWEVLATLPGINRSLAKNIVRHRGEGYTGMSQLRNAPGMSEQNYNNAAPLITLASSTFCIDGVAETFDGKIRKRMRVIFRRDEHGGKTLYRREY